MKCEQPTSPCWRKLAALRRQPGSGLQLLSQLGLGPARQALAAWGVMGAGGGGAAECPQGCPGHKEVLFPGTRWPRQPLPTSCLP